VYDEQTLMFYGLGKVGGTKGGRRYENWSIYGTVCVQFLTFYDWQAARAKNAKVLNPPTNPPKTFMLISTHRSGEAGKWVELNPPASSGKLSQASNVDTVSKKCLFRIWQSVIYGPITFNFTCGPSWLGNAN